MGVNIDHVATLRQARKCVYPDPVVAVLLASRAGCDSIVAHLREDRRHIRERDIRLLGEALDIAFNLEMSIDEGVVREALRVTPEQSTLVPERRQELTTEGGLDLVRGGLRVGRAIARLKAKNIKVSVFLDPARNQIKLAHSLGADIVEINTGKYSQVKDPRAAGVELAKIKDAAGLAASLGFPVAAGHGLNYDNVKPIALIKAIGELNIGHAIISRAVFIGMAAAVEEMVGLINP